MASETPQNASFDTASNDFPAASADSPSRQTLPSVWRTAWQWVALAWLGGVLIGSVFLVLVLSPDPNTGSRLEVDAVKISAVVIGIVFLMVAPGAYATWQTWQGYCKSMGRSPLKFWDKGH